MRRKRRMVKLCGWFHGQLVVGSAVTARIRGRKTACQVVKVIEEPGDIRLLVIEDHVTKARYPVRVR